MNKMFIELEQLRRYVKRMVVEMPDNVSMDELDDALSDMGIDERAYEQDHGQNLDEDTSVSARALANPDSVPEYRVVFDEKGELKVKKLSPAERRGRSEE